MTFRNLLMIAVLAAVGIVLAGQISQLLADQSVWPPDDFVEYWAAAKLTLNGQNPYEESLLLPLQQHAGRDTQDAIMMWNPPWSLPAVLPLGLLPARAAQILWLLLHLAVTGFCADRLWFLLGGDRSRRWIAWATAFLFMPSVFALSSGQISPFLLLGAVLFLDCIRRAEEDSRWEFAAGAATVLVAIKPHLAYLLWAAIAVEAITRGRWRVIVGGALTGIVCALLPLAFNPQVWHQYADAMGNRPPAQWLSPTLGTVLRMVFGAEYFRLQFVSVVVGLAWFAWFRWKHRHNWNWTDQLPLLLLVSFVTAPYGAWPFDMVLLLPAIFAMLAKAHRSLLVNRSWAPGSPRFTVAGVLGINLGCLALNLCQTGSFWFLWISPAVLVLYVLQLRLQPMAVASANSPEPMTVPA
jgi:hypothetical protein